MARSLSGISQTIAELSHSARHDALTMLPNRRAFQEQLEAALSARQPATLILVDLDRFKPVNDTYGHPVGDALLQGIAHRLGRAASRVRGTAARLGGDEFAAFVAGEGAEDRALDLARGFLASLDRPVEALGISIAAGASIGMASAPYDGRRFTDLVAAADVALYQAKSAGRGRMCRFGTPHIRLVSDMNTARRGAVAGAHRSLRA